MVNLVCLLADIEAGRTDCVAVYKVDRLSRSLLDFAKTIELFDRQKGVNLAHDHARQGLCAGRKTAIMRLYDSGRAARPA